MRVGSGSFPISILGRTLEDGSMSSATNSTADDEHSPLRRLSEGHILGGVASGLADYLDIDTAIVRIAFAALCFLGGIAIPVYVAGWLLIPEEGSDSTIADDLLEHAGLG